MEDVVILPSHRPEIHDYASLGELFRVVEVAEKHNAPIDKQIRAIQARLPELPESQSPSIVKQLQALVDQRQIVVVTSANVTQLLGKTDVKQDAEFCGVPISSSVIQGAIQIGQKAGHGTLVQVYATDADNPLPLREGELTLDEVNQRFIASGNRPVKISNVNYRVLHSQIDDPWETRMLSKKIDIDYETGEKAQVGWVKTTEKIEEDFPLHVKDDTYFSTHSIRDFYAWAQWKLDEEESPIQFLDCDDIVLEKRESEAEPKNKKKGRQFSFAFDGSVFGEEVFPEAETQQSPKIKLRLQDNLTGDDRLGDNSAIIPKAQNLHTLKAYAERVKSVNPAALREGVELSESYGLFIVLKP